MARMRKKSDLPQKPCATCGRPFTWRKKWEKVWDDVRYCSDRCRDARPKGARTLADMDMDVDTGMGTGTGTDRGRRR